MEKLLFVVQVSGYDEADSLDGSSIQQQIWWAVSDYIDDKAYRRDLWEIEVEEVADIEYLS